MSYRAVLLPAVAHYIQLRYFSVNGTHTYKVLTNTFIVRNTSVFYCLKSTWKHESRVLLEDSKLDNKVASRRRPTQLLRNNC